MFTAAHRAAVRNNGDTSRFLDGSAYFSRISCAIQARAVVGADCTNAIYRLRILPTARRAAICVGRRSGRSAVSDTFAFAGIAHASTVRVAHRRLAAALRDGFPGVVRIAAGRAAIARIRSTVEVEHQQRVPRVPTALSLHQPQRDQHQGEGAQQANAPVLESIRRRHGPAPWRQETLLGWGGLGNRDGALDQSTQRGSGRDDRKAAGDAGQPDDPSGVGVVRIPRSTAR